MPAGGAGFPQEVSLRKFSLRVHGRFIAIPLVAVLLLTSFSIQLSPFTPVQRAHAVSFDHGSSGAVDESCHQTFFSPDGNPFPLCPRPLPGGGNCVWWVWEQWHLLGYNLPLNWGNAANWVVDAEWTGFSLGKTPRVGSIAVFPRADGVWALGAAGHAAFVTWVSPDGGTFNVTYQNYGDPTPMHSGTGYNVSVINEPRYQNGELRFIYFPRSINPRLFSQLPGVNRHDLAGARLSNSKLTRSRLTLGLPPSSSDQEFNSDFTGTGLSDLLLYDRQKGSLDVLSLSNTPPHKSHLIPSEETPNKSDSVVTPRRVSLSDATTPVYGWGSSLDIHVGDFTGSGRSEMLLYDRISGKLQLIRLTPQLTIERHVTLPGWGAGWELYVGRLDGQRSGIFMYNRFANSSTPPTKNSNDSGSSTLEQWYLAGRTANVVVFDFNADFTIRHQQQYGHWHNFWEVYTGRFVNPNQDGIFLYDRTVGEARMLSYDSNLLISNYHELHGLKGNWQVHSGDFASSGHAQVLLYDPGQGNGQFLVFGSELSLVRQQSYAGWPVNEVFYVGHFGTPMLNAMLYDPQAGTSTFVVFNTKLKIMQLHTVKSWDEHWQILIGSFLDRSRCLAGGTCSSGDDILVLNRQTGEIEQYVFSFGHQYQVFDNRSQVFDQNGAASKVHVWTVDTTSFSLVATVATNIRGQELY